jgi:hypothetical protein
MSGIPNRVIFSVLVASPHIIAEDACARTIIEVRFSVNHLYAERTTLVKENAAANAVRDEIRAAANHIATSLQKKGEIALDQLASEARLDSHICDWAIGYLVQQDEIEIMRDGNSFTIRRKKPDTHAPVFI